MRAATVALAALLWAATSACVYRHTVEPLDTDFHAAPVFAGEGHLTMKELRVRVADVQWASNAVGDIAREHGLSRVWYADLETFSVLGVWNEFTLHVYGE